MVSSRRLGQLGGEGEDVGAKDCHRDIKCWKEPCRIGRLPWLIQ
jgi:hypothetical protein